jgi:uncharacterized protein YdhG (YjbR/CyaY superfamily)
MGLENQDHERAQPIASPDRDPLRGSRQVSFVVGRTIDPSRISTPVKPKTIDEYLAAVDARKRAALEGLRRAIHEAAPQAEECMGYGIPGFRLAGRYLVGFGATSKHCALYLGSTAQRFTKELKRFETSKGTIRFQAENPLPRSLVRKMIKARIAERMQVD